MGNRQKWILGKDHLCFPLLLKNNISQIEPWHFIQIAGGWSKGFGNFLDCCGMQTLYDKVFFIYTSEYLRHWSMVSYFVQRDFVFYSHHIRGNPPTYCSSLFWEESCTCDWMMSLILPKWFGILAVCSRHSLYGWEILFQKCFSCLKGKGLFIF